MAAGGAGKIIAAEPSDNFAGVAATLWKIMDLKNVRVVQSQPETIIGSDNATPPGWQKLRYVSLGEHTIETIISIYAIKLPQTPLCDFAVWDPVTHYLHFRVGGLTYCYMHMLGHYYPPLIYKGVCEPPLEQLILPAYKFLIPEGSKNVN